MDRPFLIQGHRGARGLRPENTLPSFEAALDAGANSLETDVYLTSDGVPVLIHDPFLPGSRIPVSELAAANVCEPTFGFPRLADLYQFIAEYAADTARKTDAQRTNAARVLLDVEIKWTPFRAAALGQNPEAVERAVLEVIRAAGMVGRTWVRSFDHRCVRRLRKMEPGLTGVAIIEGTAPVDPVALARAADAQVYGPNYLFLDEEQVRQCHDAGIRVLPWTVNEPADWERLIAWDVDGITTDYPDRLAAFIGREK